MKIYLKKELLQFTLLRLNVETYDFDCRLLLKRGGKSSLEQFYYEPVIFISTNKILREYRMELTFLCMLLERFRVSFRIKLFILIRKEPNVGLSLVIQRIL